MVIQVYTKLVKKKLMNNKEQEMDLCMAAVLSESDLSDNDLIESENDLIESENEEEHSDCDDEVDFLKNVNISHDIAEWYVTHKISEAAGNGLLKVLKKYHPNLPQNIKTLKKTPRENSTDRAEIFEMGEGQYSHIGLRKSVEKFLKTTFFKENVIKFDVGIDGVPLTKSSNSQIWPILGNIIPYKEVFMIGIFHGYKKPACANTFLQPFIDEMEDIKKKPIIYKGNRIQVEIRSFICDAPARSYILGKLNRINVSFFFFFLIHMKSDVFKTLYCYTFLI